MSVISVMAKFLRSLAASTQGQNISRAKLENCRSQKPLDKESWV